MKPTTFEGQNVVYAENQKEYEPLPAHRDKDGTVTSCWELDDEDIEHLTKNRKLFVSQMTFGKPLQPINFFHNVIFLDEEEEKVFKRPDISMFKNSDFCESCGSRNCIC